MWDFFSFCSPTFSQLLGLICSTFRILHGSSPALAYALTVFCLNYYIRFLTSVPLHPAPYLMSSLLHWGQSNSSKTEICWCLFSGSKSFSCPPTCNPLANCFQNKIPVPQLDTRPLWTFLLPASPAVPLAPPPIASSAQPVIRALAHSTVRLLWDRPAPSLWLIAQHAAQAPASRQPSCPTWAVRAHPRPAFGDLGTTHCSAWPGFLTQPWAPDSQSCLIPSRLQHWWSASLIVFLERSGAMYEDISSGPFVAGLALLVRSFLFPS